MTCDTCDATIDSGRYCDACLQRAFGHRLTVGRLNG